MELKDEKNLKLWKELCGYCPELHNKNKPKDRNFFFNILNTESERCMDKIVRNAILDRQINKKIDDRIHVIP